MPRKKAAPRPLHAEGWGERMKRAYLAQKAATGRTYTDIVEEVSQVIPIHTETIRRFEHGEAPPHTRKARMNAYLVVLSYGFDPAEWELTDDDLPPSWDKQQLYELLIPKPNPRSDQGKHRSRWNEISAA